MLPIGLSKAAASGHVAVLPTSPGPLVLAAPDNLNDITGKAGHASLR